MRDFKRLLSNENHKVSHEALGWLLALSAYFFMHHIVSVYDAREIPFGAVTPVLGHVFGWVYSIADYHEIQGLLTAIYYLFVTTQILITLAWFSLFHESGRELLPWGLNRGRQRAPKTAWVVLMFVALIGYDTVSMVGGEPWDSYRSVDDFIFIKSAMIVCVRGLMYLGLGLVIAFRAVQDTDV
ncbi:hypothetical protein [Magnetofaba australis]|uniref:Uncharacterized protein n=1 Tax=Magnetofaba australis IT-1 TaxID=1434232 RepID=A0A1Y2K956_9PROT|nr:hypothetical protein [Magnetofaba australis]OSM07284.1 hypothetical protein MAIT1_04496 [Magnetofaba australis IT-1]